MKSTEEIAERVYESNRKYCESIRDFSQIPWAEAKKVHKAFAMDIVKGILNGSYKSAEDIHTAWVDDMKSSGWKYGASKDAKKKTHPSIVAYSKLPAEQQTKNITFFMTVQPFIDKGDE